MVQVIESYKDYSPPVDAKAVVQRLLDHVTGRYLAGLKCVVLTNREQLSHNRRRSRTWSRGRKHRQADSRGLYHQAWRDEPAWIEVFVDNVVESSIPFLLRISLFRDLAFADVVYHEIGHHVHKAIRPEYREREDVADYWRAQFSRDYFRRAYWYLLPVIYPLALIVQLGKRTTRLFRAR